MPENDLPYAWNWTDGHQANRPLMPSEHRVTTTGTQRYLPWARATMDAPRPLLPWEQRMGNDWRGIKQLGHGWRVVRSA